MVDATPTDDRAEVSLEDLGQVAYNAAIQTLEDEVVAELTQPVEADGYGFNLEAATKFVRSLLRSPETLAEFIGDNVGVNLEEPLDVNGDYAD